MILNLQQLTDIQFKKKHLPGKALGKATTFLNGMWTTVSLGIMYNWQFPMKVWLIAWLETLAVVHLTDGKLNSRQMPPPSAPHPYPTLLPTAQAQYTHPTLFVLGCVALFPASSSVLSIFTELHSACTYIMLFQSLTVFCLNFESYPHALKRRCLYFVSFIDIKCII